MDEYFLLSRRQKTNEINQRREPAAAAVRGPSLQAKYPTPACLQTPIARIRRSRHCKDPKKPAQVVGSKTMANTFFKPEFNKIFKNPARSAVVSANLLFSRNPAIFPWNAVSKDAEKPVILSAKEDQQNMREWSRSPTKIWKCSLLSRMLDWTCYWRWKLISRQTMIKLKRYA